MAHQSILNDSPEHLLARFRDALASHDIPVSQLILFGSYAKGAPKPWSDLDVCVVSPIFGKNRYDEMVLLGHIAGEIEPMIEPHPYHPKDLADPWDPLAAEIRRTGKFVGEDTADGQHLAELSASNPRTLLRSHRGRVEVRAVRE